MLFLLLALRAFPFVEFPPLETPEPGELRDGDFVAGWLRKYGFYRALPSLCNISILDEKPCARLPDSGVSWGLKKERSGDSNDGLLGGL